MSKYLKLKMENDISFTLPLSVVLDSYNDHHDSKYIIGDSVNDADKFFDKSMTEVIISEGVNEIDDNELIDWLENSMLWSELKNEMVSTENPKDTNLVENYRVQIVKGLFDVELIK